MCEILLKTTIIKKTKRGKKQQVCGCGCLVPGSVYCQVLEDTLGRWERKFKDKEVPEWWMESTRIVRNPGKAVFRE